ncbi:hypothetical protein Acsp04_08510 [Actinomadura sp. NBRC 104425]|uniref:DUF1707 SHOCT-like domain-containing protein n=1 Tax=Actinomadura sp. NBRC 104425 TaxID=3032204 RepID=UPI0024A188AB|nr:DUF1707 domain-containing protein [Actinomadura sp. NBRC 104425]GLZ10616.1 hypothetical protein Acsp04_08510 [Actinomadura sp. NBRC 104425]
MKLPEPPSSSDPSPSGPAGTASGDTGAAAEPALMRASDADRDRIADLLREALAEGRITPEEHAERIDAAYRAKTYAELTPLVSDIPGAAGKAPAPPDAAQPRVNLRKQTAAHAAPDLPPPERLASAIVAVFAGAERRGRWLVEPATHVHCVFGGAQLDFRQAVLAQPEVTVNVSCIFGGVEITVPPGVRVVNSTAAIFGGVELPDDGPLEPDAPVIRLTGFALFGGVSVKRRELREQRRRIGGGRRAADPDEPRRLEH